MADYEKGKVVFNDANFEKELKKHENILIEFYNPKWGYCQAFKPAFDGAAKALSALDTPIPLGVCNVSDGSSNRIAGKFGISGTPTLIFFKAG